MNLEETDWTVSRDIENTLTNPGAAKLNAAPLLNVMLEIMTGTDPPHQLVIHFRLPVRLMGKRSHDLSTTNHWQNKKHVDASVLKQLINVVECT